MTDKNKEGFSYESPEKQKKSAVRLFALEIIALVVVVVLIVGLLNYLGIIKLPNIGKEPTQNWVSTRGPDPKNTINTERASVQPKISVVSDSSQYDIKVEDNRQLLDFVKGYDVFGKKYLLSPGVFSDFVESLELHLTDIQQPNNKYFLGDPVTPVISSKVTFEGRKLIMLIYLSPDAYKNDNTTPENFFMQSLLSNIYQMAKDPSGIGLKPEQQKELNDEIGKLVTDKKEYIDIVRK